MLLVTLALIGLAGPASAGPVVGAAIAAAFTKFVATITLKAIFMMALRVVLSAGVSLLIQKWRQRKQKPVGIQTSVTTVGGTDPQGTIIGLYATAGHLAYRNSHGANKRYLTHVIEVSDIPGVQLSRLIVDGEYSELGAVAHADYGYPIVAKNDGTNDRGWVRFVDGTHTGADAGLVASYGDDPDRPWTTNHILSGVAHFILTFDQHRPVYPNGVPQVRFELLGIALYDPRLDSSVGGTGAHRWADSATWETTTNPIVIAYNIKRGIPLPDGSIWGGDAQAEDLPLDSWSPAMNVCDQQVGTPARTRFQCGFEIRFNEQPADILEEIYASANAQVSELGGVWQVQVGAPPASIVHITDADILVSESQQYDPFPGADNTFNAISISHPSRAALWNATGLGTITNAAWEVEDGEQRLFELKLPAVPWQRQARQLARTLIRDQRRFRSHANTLPPDYFQLEPLNSIDWTSEWNSYSSKAFGISQVAYDLRTLTTAVSLREHDPDDYSFDETLDLPDPPEITGPLVVEDVGVPLFAVNSVVLTDAANTGRRVGVVATWATDIADTVDGINLQLRRAGTSSLVGASGVTPFDQGEYLFQPLLPDTAYEARARAIAARRQTAWTAWVSVTTDDIRLTADDLDDVLTVPGVPSNLQLSSALLSDGVATVTVAWTAGTNAVGNDVGVTRSGGNEVILVAGGTPFEFETVAGAQFAIRVRSVSATGTKSAWTASDNITAAIDTTPPDAPTGLEAVTGFETYWLEWDANTEADLSHYLVRQRIGADDNTNENVYRVAGTSLALTGVPASEVSWFKIYAVDTSDNQSDISAATSPESVTVPSGVTSADIEGIVDLASFAAGITPVEVLGALPNTGNFEGRQLFLTTDKKLYRHDGTDLAGITGWTNEVDGADIAANSIVSGSITAGAIGADQIAAGSIVASKLAIGDFTNLNIDEDFDDLANWALSGSGQNLNVYNTTNTEVWGSTKYASISGTAGIYGIVTGPIVTVDPAGEELWLRYSVKVQAGGGSAHVEVEYAEDEAFSINNGFKDVGVSTSTSTVEMKGDITLPAGSRFIRLRMVKGNTTTTIARFGGIQLRRKGRGELIVDGSIVAAHIDAANAVITATAQIANAIITNAKIASLDAAKITVGTALAGSITVSGTALSTVEGRADDPAAQVNAKATLIDPGKITISGGTTLSDWRKGGDLTRIDGGSISANTIAANKLTIGNRNVTLTGLTFEPNSPATDQVEWDSGTIRYIDDAGAVASVGIAAGSASWTTARLYLYWVKGATSISATTSTSTAFADDRIILAVYKGGGDIQSSYGRTVIEGDLIKTGAVTADKMTVTDLSAISANLGTISVTNANIANLTVGSEQITGNAVTKVRISSADSPSVTWTPGVDGEFTAFLYGEVSVTAVGAATTDLYIRKNTTNKGGPISVSKGDTSPGSMTVENQGTTCWKGTTSEGTSITIDTNGNGTNCDLIVIETKK